jgi:hypothetical protein
VDGEFTRSPVDIDKLEADDFSSAQAEPCEE